MAGRSIREDPSIDPNSAPSISERALFAVIGVYHCPARFCFRKRIRPPCRSVYGAKEYLALAPEAGSCLSSTLRHETLHGIPKRRYFVPPSDLLVKTFLSAIPALAFILLFTFLSMLLSRLKVCALYPSAFSFVPAIAHSRS